MSEQPDAEYRPAYCAVHQHYKWCEHNGGVMGATGYGAPRDLPALEREVRSYAADSADVILRRALTGVLEEYDRVRAELDRIHQVQCRGCVYDHPENPPERCGHYAGHEGKCEP
jgi:hypothetical protein